MEKILKYIISGVLLYLLKKLFDRAIEPKYPKDYELELLKKRFKIYKKLFYSFCVDFSEGKRIPKSNILLENYINKIEDFYVEYLQNSENTELLSFKFQKRLRNFMEKRNRKSLQKLRLTISRDYTIICKQLHYTSFDLSSKEKLSTYSYLTFATFSIILDITAILFLSLSQTISFFILISSILFALATFAIYFLFLRSNF